MGQVNEPIAPAQPALVAGAPRPASASRFPGWARLALGLLVSGGLFWLAIAQVDLRQLVVVLEHARYEYVAGAVGTYFASLGIRALRWKVLLSRTGRVSAWRLYPVLVIGYMANNLLPGRLGELSRAYLVGQRERVSASAVLATVAIERVVDGLFVLGLLVLTLRLLPIPALQAGWIGLLTRAAVVTFGIAMIGFVALLAGREVWLDLARRALGRLPSHLVDRLVAALDRFIAGLSVLRDPLQVTWTVGLSLLVWGVSASTYLLVAEAFGVPLSLAGALAAICAVNLATAVPQAPAGLGAFEAMALQMFLLLGADSATAFGITLVLHAVMFFPVVLAGLFCLWRLNLPLLGPSRA